MLAQKTIIMNTSNQKHKTTLHRDETGWVIGLTIWSSTEEKMVYIDDAETITKYMELKRKKQQALKTSNYLMLKKSTEETLNTFNSEACGKKKRTRIYKKARKGQINGC